MNKIFNNLLVQNNAAGILGKIIASGKIPHAFLFCGHEGYGKEYLARAFAIELTKKYSPANSENIITHINKLNEPYVKYIFPLPRGKNETDSVGPYEKLLPDDIELIKTEVGKKSVNPFYKIFVPKAKNIKINSIREIRKFLSTNYQDVRFRFVIISEAHLMNEEAQNSLLKNLEEPPEGVIFILCTSSPEQLRKTIHSRCWTLNLEPLTHNQLRTVLTEYFGISIDSADLVIPFANGSVTNAIELIDNDFKELRELTIRILRNSFGKKFYTAFSEFDDIMQNKDEIRFKLIIRMIITWLNDLYRFRSGYENHFFNEHLITLQKFNTKYPQMQLNDVTYKIDNLNNVLKNNINLNLAIACIITELSAIIP